MKPYTLWPALFLLFNVIIVPSSALWTYWPRYSISTIHPATNVEIHDCSTNDFVLHIHQIKISPDIITPGGDVVIEAKGTLDEAVIDGSKADVTIKLGRVQLLHKIFDLCQELENKRDDVEIQCPIEKGELTIMQKVTLPKEVPRAKFGVLVRAETADENPLACLQIFVDFRVHPNRNRYQQLTSDEEGWYNYWKRKN